MDRLGLTLHPAKTRMVDLRRGREIGMPDWKEEEHSAEPAAMVYATVAESESNEETSGSGARVDRKAAKREGCEADRCIIY
jgi:hypothetical protein